MRRFLRSFPREADRKPHFQPSPEFAVVEDALRFYNSVIDCVYKEAGSSWPPGEDEGSSLHLDTGSRAAAPAARRAPEGRPACSLSLSDLPSDILQPVR